jgi:RNA polymerase sigma-B factor
MRWNKMSKSKHHPNNDEVHRWIKKVQEEEGNQFYQTKIVQKYENLVQSLAKKFSKGKSMHDDLYQVGMVGLLAAVRRYDESYGKSFEMG